MIKSELDILIVQNGAAENLNLQQRLRSLGYTACATASTVRQAVEVAAGSCPALALVDLEMDGGVGGIEVAEQLRDEFDVPVVYLADGGADLLRRAEASQPYGYVVKPVETRQLALSIQTALALHGRDVQRRESARALRQTISQLRRKTRIMDTILNSTKDGVVAADAAGRILFANSQAERIVGTVEDMKPGDLVDASERQKKYGLFELDKETHVATDQLPLVRALQGKATDDREVFIRNEQTPDGVYVTVTGRTLMSDGRAEIKGGVVFFRDVTREKEAEADLQQTLGELHDQTHLMGAVFESMDEAIFVTATDGSLIWANSRMEQMVGVGVEREKPSEWPRVYGFYEPDQQTLIAADRLPMMRVLRGEPLDDVELFIRNQRRPDGLHVRASGRPLLDERGEIQAGVIVLHDISGQKLAEARLEQTVLDLRAQTQLMQTVFDNMEEGVLVADTAGNFLLTNLRREQIVGMKLIASEPDDWPAAFGAFYLDQKTHVPTDELPLVRAMRGEATEEVELFIRNEKRPDGTYIRTRGRPLLDSDRNVIAGVAIFSDITKYKQTEAALERTIRDLQAQAQLVDTVFESISDGVVAADAEGQFTIFNSSAERIIGMGMMTAPPEQWTQRYGIFRADKKTPFPTDQLPLVHAMEGKSTDDVEMFIRNEKRPSGVFISVNGRPLRTNKEGHGGGVVTFRDVTNRKIAEIELQRAIQELRDQGELMEATFNGISDGLAVVNTAGELLSINPVGRRIAGLESMDASQAQLAIKWGTYYYADRETLIPPEDLPLNRVIFQGEAISDMDMFVRSRKKPDGFFVRVSAWPLLHAEGGIRGGVVIFRDVTDQMLAEEMRMRAFAQGRLEIIDTILHNIGNAISSVTIGMGTLQETLNDNPLLRHLRTLADAARSHEADWADYVAHHPQGQQVLPYITLLAEGFARQNDELAKTVVRVVDRAHHIADIIRTEKALDRPHMNRKDLDLEHAISAAVKVLHDSLHKRGITVEVHCDRAPREIRTQESQFHQMLVNLIKNSIEAIEAIDDQATTDGLKEAPRICIRAYPEGDFLHLDVTDNGIGIDGKNFKIVFAAGYTTKKNGSGLGLHSSANFVIGTGGQIHALSNGIGKGATLRVMLRLSSILPAARKPFAAIGN